MELKNSTTTTSASQPPSAEIWEEDEHDRRIDSPLQRPQKSALKKPRSFRRGTVASEVDHLSLSIIEEDHDAGVDGRDSCLSAAAQQQGNRAKTDFQASSCSRWVFLVTLLLAATGLATAVYVVSSRESAESFENEASPDFYFYYAGF
jgi:hypothetical protein